MYKRDLFENQAKTFLSLGSYAIESCKSSVKNRLRGRQRESYERSGAQSSPADELFSFMFQEFAMNGTRSSVLVRRGARIWAQKAGNLEISARLHSDSSASYCCNGIPIDVENTHQRALWEEENRIWSCFSPSSQMYHVQNGEKKFFFMNESLLFIEHRASPKCYLGRKIHYPKLLYRFNFISGGKVFWGQIGVATINLVMYYKLINWRVSLGQ